MCNPTKHGRTDIEPARKAPALSSRKLSAIFMFVLICVVGTGIPANSETIAPDTTHHRRIVEATEEGDVKKVIMFPAKVVAYPFQLMGKGIEKSLLGVEQGNLIAKSVYFSRRLAQQGVSILYGVGYDGAGFGGGVSWRPNAGPVIPMVSGAISVRLYQVYRAGLDLPPMLGKRLGATGETNYKYLPQEDFYGIGPDSRLEDRTNYKREETELALDLIGNVSRTVRFDADVEYANSNIHSGEDEETPTTEDVFPPGTVPGLHTGAELLSTTLSVSFHGLDYPDDPTSGVYAKVLVGLCEDLEGDAYDFWRTFVEVRGAVGLLGRGNRFGPRSTLVVRCLADLNEPRGEGGVPFFRMPRIGGSNTLRGFSEWRFTDENAVLFNVEYRYPIQTLLEAVIFWDEGQVFPDPDDFRLDRFRSSFGGGVRVVHHHAMFVRLELAKSSEAWRWTFKFGGAF